MVKKLFHIWKYSDSQPTEIMLGVVNFSFTPIAIYYEVGFMPFFIPLLIAGGAFQLWTVSTEQVCKRVKGAFFSLCLFVVTLLLYLNSECGLYTPVHYGWVFLVICSLGSLIRIKNEQLHNE